MAGRRLYFAAQAREHTHSRGANSLCSQSRCANRTGGRLRCGPHAKDLRGGCARFLARHAAEPMVNDGDRVNAEPEVCIVGEDPRDELVRELSLSDAVFLVVACVIGAGIFFTPGRVAELIPHPYWILAAWLFGGLLSLAGALAKVERRDHARQRPQPEERRGQLPGRLCRRGQEQRQQWRRL